MSARDQPYVWIVRRKDGTTAEHRTQAAAIRDQQENGARPTIAPWPFDADQLAAIERRITGSKQ